MQVGYMPMPSTFKYMDVFLRGKPQHEGWDSFTHQASANARISLGEDLRSLRCPSRDLMKPSVRRKSGTLTDRTG
jgi:hypothetical protein